MLTLEGGNEPLSSQPGLLHKAVHFCSQFISVSTSTCAFQREMLFTLLPGDSFRFDFWKARLNQSAVCCGFIPPISCEIVPVWAGLTSFLPLSLPAHLRLVQGTGEGFWHQPVDQLYCIYTKYCVGAPTRDEIRLFLFIRLQLDSMNSFRPIHLFL